MRLFDRKLIDWIARHKVISLVLFAACVAFMALLWPFGSRQGRASAFLAVPIKRGDLLATISATGTLEPEAAVDIGAQVAGVIVAFGKDKSGKQIDWGSQVDEGTVLARIDDSLYAAAVETAQAQLAQGKATVLASQANVMQQTANLLYASQNWDRAQKLGPSDALAQAAYDQYESSYEVAKANLAAAKAAVEQARAAVAQYKASLHTAQINLNYCTIRSPVKGVIIDRRVNIGQTVVSSLSAPSLFLIANDLRRIQLWVSVNEADVGSIAPDQAVTFTVDAFPGRVFRGRVGEVRLNATMTQNVVTYTIEVDIDNSNGALIPYLTANAQFEIGRRQGVLLVPNSALQWTPRADQIAPEFRRGAAKSPNAAEERSPSKGSALIWIEAGKFVRPVAVRVGLSDGNLTEVQGGGLRDGLGAVIGETKSRSSAESTERNPFAPQLFRSQGSSQAPTPGQAAQAGPPSASQ